MKETSQNIKKKDVKEIQEPAFVGREEIMNQMTESLVQSHQATPRFLLLHGEQGIGKSRLVKEFQDKARSLEKETFFLEESCKQNDELTPFMRVMHIIFKLYSQLGILQKKQYAGNFPPMLAPDFVEFAISHLTEETLTDIFTSVESNVEKIFASTSCYVRSHAQGKALCIVIDNLHFLDRQTGEWLVHFVSNIAKGDSLLVIGMYRGDQLTGENGFQRVFPRFKGVANFKEIKLMPLLARDILPMMQSILNPLQIDQTEITQIYKTTRGVPYLVVSFIKEMAEQGKIFWENEAWNLDLSEDMLKKPPQGVEELLIKNYDKLGRHHQSILEWLMIADSPLSLDHIITLTGFKAAQLHYIFADLLKERYLLEEDVEQNKIYDLSSSKVGAEILKKMDEKSQNKMHIQLGKLLEKQKPKNEIFLKAADHFFQGKDTGKTLTISLEAARWLAEQKRFSLALRYYKRALTIAKEEKKGILGTILSETGMTLYRLGNYEDALANFNAAVSLVKGEEEKQVKKGKGLCLYGTGKYDAAVKELRNFMTIYKTSDPEILLIMASIENYRLNIAKSEEYLAQAQEMLKKSPSDILMPILKKNEAWLYFYQGKWKDAMSVFEEAEKLSIQLQNNQNLSETLLGKACLLLNTQGIAEAWKSLQHVLTYAHDTDSFHLSFQANYQAGMLFLEQGNMEKAKECFAQVEAITKKRGADRENGYAILGMGYHSWLSKDLENAEKQAQQALDIANTFGDQFLIAEAYILLSTIAQRGQKLGQAQKYLDYAKEGFLKLHLKWKANRTFNQYAHLFIVGQKCEHASKFLEEGEKNASEINDQYFMADNYLERGFCHYQNKNLNEAIQLFTWAERLYEKQGRKLYAMQAKQKKQKCSLSLQGKQDTGKFFNV